MDHRIFFVGLTIIILGLLIIAYDYPQIIYIQTISEQSFDKTELDRFERVQSEFHIGIGMFVTGTVILFFSKFPPAAFNKK